MNTHTRNAAIAVVVLAAIGVVQHGSIAMPAPVVTPVLFSGPSAERDSIVAFEARRAGMDPDLAIAISHVENWGGDSTTVHPRTGATGLMQVMPFWADSFPVECYGSDTLIVRRRNACIGVQIAMRYFQECGNWNCALVWYVGARCTGRDTPARCARKSGIGKDYVLEVVERFGRTDLSPARDAMSLGGWRGDQAVSGSVRPARISGLEPHSLARLAAAAGAPLQ